MIKIGKLTDYAVVIMTKLSQDSCVTPRSAVYLSLKTGVPEPTVSKILKILSKEQLVISKRGASGGYISIYSPDDVTVLQVIEAFEGRINLTSWLESVNDGCETEESCPISRSWEKVNETIRNALGGITLRDLISGCEHNQNCMDITRNLSAQITASKRGLG